jgi:hypothetical protein
VQGAYEIAVNRPPSQDGGSLGEALLPGTYGDAALAVDVALVGGGPSSAFYLACRSQDEVSQYRFRFNPTTGEALIVRWLPVPESNVPRNIPLMPLGIVAPIAHAPNATYHAELSCHGTTIEARLNGTTVASVSDNTFANGQLWLAAGEVAGTPSSGPRAKARFSNLVVTQE